MLNFDLVSDVHVEHWNNNYDFLQHKNSDLLVVAGDVSDDPKLTVEWLNRVKDEYKQILFIDGNHEHQGVGFPMNSLCDQVYDETKDIENLHYLTKQPYVKDNCVFLGINGWWDFKIGEPYVPRSYSFEHTTKQFGQDTAIKILKQSASDYAQMANWLADYQWNDSIESIVCITHTLPVKRAISWAVYPPIQKAVGCYGNALMEELPLYYNKIKLWCFGHNHDQQEFVQNTVTYHSNPRGRPEDFNRETYTPKTIFLK